MANETPVSDDELESLMAELEEATGVSAVATPPKKTVSPATTPEPEVSDEDLAGLEDEVEASAPTPEPAIVLPDDPNEPVVLDDGENTMVLPAPSHPVEPNVDDELAALEAEIASGTVAAPETPPWETQVHAPSAPHETAVDTLGQVHTPEPVVLTEPTPAAPEPKAAAPASKLVPAPAGLSAEEEEALAAATKKKAKASLDYYIDVDKFKSEMQVTETNLDNCMMQQASLRAFHGAQAARAEAQASSIKARFEVKEAQLYHNHRTALVGAGEKVTEKAVENAVKMDPKWIAMKIMVIEAESIAAVAKSCVNSLSDRRDMIIQLGADRRDESKGQARVMQAQADRESLTNRAVSAARVANG